MSENQTTQTIKDLINIAPERTPFEIVSQFDIDSQKLFRPTVKLILSIKKELADFQNTVENKDDVENQIKTGYETLKLYLKTIGVTDTDKINEVLDELTINEFKNLITFFQGLFQ